METTLVHVDGTTTGMVLMLKYAGVAPTHSTTGRTIEGSGVDRIVFDFVTGDRDLHRGPVDCEPRGARDG